MVTGPVKARSPVIKEGKIMHVPLFSHPVGWLLLGAVGYLVYKSGKKAGNKEVGGKKEIKPVKKETHG